ncbi:MAG: CPBP family intramembrane metalloprotease [Firmicutes bacterium]|nr:CPBP family intramembrane metalloprotease [Bacillota bacterium]
MNQRKTIICCVCIEIIVILCVALANVYPRPFWYFFWYHLLYGVACSFLVPIFLLHKEKSLFALMGLRPFGKRQLSILVVFVGFSVGGQLIPMVAAGRAVPWELLPMGVVPLIMTTFFEEFFFQGFCQTRLEKAFGALPAILASGLMFSLYHLGYPGFRTLEDLMLLFAVGVGFAAAYKLSGSNLVVAYFVNLPNAFVTYMLKFEQFPSMELSSTIASVVTLCVIFAVFVMLVYREKNGRGKTKRENEGVGWLGCLLCVCVGILRGPIKRSTDLSVCWD